MTNVIKLEKKKLPPVNNEIWECTNQLRIFKIGSEKILQQLWRLKNIEDSEDVENTQVWRDVDIVTI